MIIKHTLLKSEIELDVSAIQPKKDEIFFDASTVYLPCDSNRLKSIFCIEDEETPSEFTIWTDLAGAELCFYLMVLRIDRNAGTFAGDEPVIENYELFLTGEEEALLLAGSDLV